MSADSPPQTTNFCPGCEERQREIERLRSAVSMAVSELADSGMSRAERDALRVLLRAASPDALRIARQKLDGVRLEMFEALCAELRPEDGS